MDDLRERAHGWNTAHDFSGRPYENWGGFSRYFKGGDSTFERIVSKHDRCFELAAVQVVSAGVELVCYVGSGNARNMAPFLEHGLNVVCTDLAPEQEITRWHPSVETRVIYVRCAVHDVLEMLSCVVGDDLSRVALMTQCALMYVGETEQRELLEGVINRGCKNILFHEFRGTDFSERQRAPFAEQGRCCWIEPGVVGSLDVGWIKCTDERFADHDDLVPWLIGALGGQAISAELVKEEEKKKNHD